MGEPKEWVTVREAVVRTRARMSRSVHERSRGMGEPKEWVTVREAAALVGKSPRTIYEWIEDDRLATKRDAQNRLVVMSKAVVRVEPSIRRGRPRGTPTRRP